MKGIWTRKNNNENAVYQSCPSFCSVWFFCIQPSTPSLSSPGVTFKSYLTWLIAEFNQLTIPSLPSFPTSLHIHLLLLSSIPSELRCSVLCVFSAFLRWYHHLQCFSKVISSPPMACQLTLTLRSVLRNLISLLSFTHSSCYLLDVLRV